MANIVEITENNLSDYPQAICFINPKHELYPLKLEWLKAQFKLGLKIKLYINPENKKVSGFIEYIPGEFASRGVAAKDYLFIHCIWTNPNNIKNQGYGSELVAEVISEAKSRQMKGIAIITSDSSFMVKKDLFLKNGFKVIEEYEKFQLLTIEIDGTKPTAKFKYDPDKLKQYHGWHIYYSKQCPWVARFTKEIESFVHSTDLNLTVHEFKSPKEMQEFGTVYSVFNLIKDGKLLADRYISVTRFKNIIRNESKGS